MQDVLTCIREHLTIDKAGRRLAVNAERFLKDPDEMAHLFHAAPEAFAETLGLDAVLTFHRMHGSNLTRRQPQASNEEFLNLVHQRLLSARQIEKRA